MVRIIYLLVISMPLLGATMQELVDLGLKQNTAIEQSRLQTQQAQLLHQQSQIEQYGSLDLVGDFVHYNTPRTLAPLTPSAIGSGTPIATTEDLFSGGLTYSVPLFTGFEQTRQIQIQALGKQIAHIKHKLTQEQLVYNIKSLYLAILAQQEIKNAQHTYTQALKKLKSQIAYEVELGKKAKIDLIKAQSDLRASQTQEEIFQSNITITKATLASLVGMDQIVSVSPLHINIKKPRYNADMLLDNALHLAKIEIKDMEVKKADKTVEKNKSSALPQINLSSYVGKNYGKDETLSDWDNETLWQVGVNIKWNVMDFGKRKIEVQKAKIAKMEATLEKEQARLDLKKMLIESIEKINQGYEEYSSNSAQITLLKESETIEKVRYQNGVSTLNDLLLARSRTHLAHAQLIQSKFEYQKNIYYLEYIMETGVHNE
ncbi:MAG TPA: hypothetical protein CFH81_04390 [Sulfurovum sp. UBA12169]|nr:MAG TPA: hypothetical protein CFH81_04390 [Sulfurovum sp. UBA12169]